MAEFDAPQSRNEAILQNMLGANNEIGDPQSRIEELLIKLLEQGGTAKYEYSVVDTLPQNGENGIIYLVANDHDGYDRYVWNSDNREYVFIGDTNLDLSGYYTKNEIDTAYGRLPAQVESIDAAMPIAEQSGAVVSFVIERAPVELSKCVVTIPTRQEGAGTPAPDNVRPIIGYTSGRLYISPDATTENASIIAINFPTDAGTVYGGQLSVLTGELTVTAGYKKLIGNGDEGISLYSGTRFKVPVAGFSSAEPSVKMPIVADRLQTVSRNLSSTAFCICQGDLVGRAEMLINLGEGITTVEAANAWLSENNVDIVYPLATPLTYHLMPMQVLSLQGQNYIWADMGAIDVSYIRDIEGLVSAAVSFVEDSSYVNVYNPADPAILIGQQIRGSGAISAWANCTVSGYVQCKAGDVFTMPVYTKHFGTGSGATTVPLYDADKAYLGYASGTIISVDGVSAFLQFTISDPAAAYFRANVLRVSVNSGDIITPFHANNNFMIVKGASFPEQFVPYTGLRIIADNIYSAHADLSNPLYGKKAVFLGDSICEAAGDALGGWPVRIGSANQMISENGGIGGSTISTAVPSKTICTRQILTVAPNYIVFEGGTNDADHIGDITGGSIPPAFGSYSEGYWGTDDPSAYYGFDISTFCGGFEYLCKRLTTEYAGVKIGYIVAQKMGSGTNYRNRYAYFLTAMRICDKWGIPYLDLWNGCYLNPTNPAHYTSGAANTMYLDGQHLTTRGYDYITPIIAAWMRTL